MNENPVPFQKKKDDVNTYTVSFWEAILFAGIVLVVGQFAGGIVSIPAYIYPPLNHLLIPLGFAVGFGLSAYLIMRIKGLNWQDAKDLLRPLPNWKVFLLVLLFYFSGLAIAEYLTALIPTDNPDWMRELYKIFEELFSMIFDYKVAAFITVCFLAPLFEEFIFRGLILRGMLNYKIHPAVAILTSALLFGLAHLNPWQFVGAGFLGAMFGYVYYRTRSLWMVIFLHFLNNTIAFSMTMIYGDMEEMVFEENYTVLGISAGLLLVFGYIIYKTTSPNGTRIRHSQQA